MEYVQNNFCLKYLKCEQCCFIGNAVTSAILIKIIVLTINILLGNIFYNIYKDLNVRTGQPVLAN